MQATTVGEECYAYSSRRMHTIPEGHAPLATEDIYCNNMYELVRLLASTCMYVLSSMLHTTSS